MIPGSALADLIAEGKASASMKTLMALSEAAADGDVEAVKALAEIRERNRFDRLLNYMDEDELAL
jgi:hypothetical protein